MELASIRFLLIETANSLDAFMGTAVAIAGKDALDFDSLKFPSHPLCCAQTTALCLRFMALYDEDVGFNTASTCVEDQLLVSSGC